MDLHNSEHPDAVLADLEAKHGSSPTDGSADVWKRLALRLVDDALTVIGNAHWEVRYGTGDMQQTIDLIRRQQLSDLKNPPNDRISDPAKRRVD